MAVLVTGGAGYIGSHVVLALLDHGEEVIVLDNLSTGHMAAVPGTVEFLNGDMLDDECLHTVFINYDIDTVIHLAAKISVPQSIEDPSGYYEANVGGTLSLLARAAQHGVKRFLFASSAAVYAQYGAVTGREDAYPLPYTPYGHSKAFGERMIADICQREQIAYATLRFFNVGGADPQMRSGQRNTTGSIIKSIARVAVGLDPLLTVHGTKLPTFDGFAVRDYIHVSDVADGVLHAMHHLKSEDRMTLGLLANVGSGRATSIKQLIQLTESHIGRKLPVEYGPERPGNVPVMISHPEALMATGWRPERSYPFAILKDAIEWERTCMTSNAS